MVISACPQCIFPWNLVQISLTNTELLIFSSKIKDGGRRHLGFVWVSHVTTHEASFMERTSCKNCYDRLSSFQVIRIWFFFVQAWKSYSRPQNFSFWGILPPKFRGTSLRHPKGTSLSGTTRFVLSLVQIWRTVRPVALAKKPKKEKKTPPRQWQTGYSPRPPTSPYRSQSLHAGWSPECSSIFQVLLKSVQWFWRCGWSNIALSHYFGHCQWLIQQLVLPYKPW